MFSTLRNMVDQLKEHPQAKKTHVQENPPRCHKVQKQRRVREDTIAEMRIEELQEILREDIDLIFDALVIHDYIEEINA